MPDSPDNQSVFLPHVSLLFLSLNFIIFYSIIITNTYILSFSIVETYSVSCYNAENQKGEQHMELRVLQYFLAVAREQSIVRFREQQSQFPPSQPTNGRWNVHYMEKISGVF